MDGSEIPLFCPWGQSELVQIVHDGGKPTSRWGHTSIISRRILYLYTFMVMEGGGGGGVAGNQFREPFSFGKGGNGAAFQY
jgi:hypothetical protein